MRVLGGLSLILILLGYSLIWSAPGFHGISVPIFIHIIQPTSRPLVTDEQILRQMEYLNSTVEYSRDLHFTLSGVERVINPVWFAVGPNSPYDPQMRRELAVGGMQVIDVYLVSNKGMRLNYFQEVYGYTILPWNVEDPYEDGCVVQYSTLPGGFKGDGDVIAHELGHALGLWDITVKPLSRCSDIMYGYDSVNSCSKFTLSEIESMVASFKAYRQ